MMRHEVRTESTASRPPAKGEHRIRFWLTTEHGSVAATWFWPRTPLTRSAAVVIVAGIAHEERITATGLAALGEAMCASGTPALLFDLGGTAQSTGSLDDPGIVERWLDDIRQAVQHVHAIGIDHVTLIGLRTGALLACVATQTMPVDAMALWCPVTSGRRHGRELRLLQSVSNEAAHATSAERPDGDPAPRSIEIAGFTIRPQVLSGIASFDVTKLGAAPAREMLLMDAPERTHDDTAIRLRELGATVTERTAPGTDAWLLQAMDGSCVPTIDIGTLVSWVTARSAGRTAIPPDLDVDQLRHELPATQVFERGAASIAETLISIGPDDLAAVWCQPADTDEQPAVAPVRVLAGSVGPGRSFVDFARDQAAAGASSVRFDFSGFGTSRRRPGQIWNGHYTPDGSEDINVVIDHVITRPGASVVLIGFCSSAWSMLRAGARPEITAVAVMNVHVYVPDRRGSILNRVARSPFERFVDRHFAPNQFAKVFHRIYRTFPLPSVPFRWIDALLDSGVRVMMYFDSHDAGFEYLQRRMPARWRGARDSGQLDVHTYGALGHSLEGSADRARLMHDLADHLAMLDQVRTGTLGT
jgi:hypothetical protein